MLWACFEAFTGVVLQVIFSQLWAEFWAVLSVILWAYGAPNCACGLPKVWCIGFQLIQVSLGNPQISCTGRESSCGWVALIDRDWVSLCSSILVDPNLQRFMHTWVWILMRIDCSWFWAYRQCWLFWFIAVLLSELWQNFSRSLWSYAHVFHHILWSISSHIDRWFSACFGWILAGTFVAFVGWFCSHLGCFFVDDFDALCGLNFQLGLYIIFFWFASRFAKLVAKAGT